MATRAVNLNSSKLLCFSVVCCLPMQIGPKIASFFAESGHKIVQALDTSSDAPQLFVLDFNGNSF